MNLELSVWCLNHEHWEEMDATGEVDVDIDIVNPEDGAQQLFSCSSCDHKTVVALDLN